MKKSASEVSKRYALALFELAQEQNILSAVLEEVRAIEPFLPVVQEVLVSPVYADENKNELLSTLLGALKVKPVLGNTLRLVLRNGRFGVVANIFRDFYVLVDESMGVSRGSLASARPIDASRLAEFENALSAQTGKKVHLATRVDESLRAGYVVEIDGMLIDASLKTRLKNLRESLSRGV